MRKAQLKFVLVTMIILMFAMAFSGCDLYQPMPIEEVIL